MKFTKLLITLGIALVLLYSCEQDLPYPLEETVHSVVIDISKTPGSDMTLSEGLTTDELSLTLNIPWQQGDYSMMKEAELMCIYYPAGGGIKHVIAKTGITSFPATVNVDMPALCAALNIAAPTTGDRMTFVPNVVLKNGMTIMGWNPMTGLFNNTAFSGWQVDFGSGNRAYSYRAIYTAFAPFYQEHYQGIVQCDDGDIYDVLVTPLPITDLPPTMPPGTTPSDLYGMLVEDIFADGTALKIWINKLDFTLIIPGQIVHTAFFYPFAPYTGYYPLRFDTFPSSFDLDTLNERIEFTADVWLGTLGGWWDTVFKLQF